MFNHTLTQHQRQANRGRVLAGTVIITVVRAVHMGRLGCVRHGHRTRTVDGGRGGGAGRRRTLLQQSGVLGADQVAVQRPDALRYDDGERGADQQAGAENRDDAQFLLAVVKWRILGLVAN